MAFNEWTPTCNQRPTSASGNSMSDAPVSVQQVRERREWVGEHGCSWETRNRREGEPHVPTE